MCCWDVDITSLLVMTGIIPENSLRLSTDWFQGQFTGLSPMIFMGKSMGESPWFPVKIFP